MSLNENPIAKWAYHRADELGGAEYGGKYRTALARYIEQHEEAPDTVNDAIASVADAVFYHNSDRDHRNRLAMALRRLADAMLAARTST